MIQSILIFSRATPHHHTGGMETMMWSLAAEWAKAVERVEVVTTEIPGATRPFVQDDITTTPLAGTRPGRYSSSWWKATRQHWNERGSAPSVVLSVSGGAYSVVRDRDKHPATPFVLQAHGTSAMEIRSKLRAHDLRSVATAPKNAFGLVRDLARYRDFDQIVAVGESVVESLAAQPQSWAVATDRVRLIPNGVRTEDHGFDPRARHALRTELGIDEGTTVVACIGRLHVQKRVDRALAAAAALRERAPAPFRFLIVGDGPDEARLRALATDLRLDDIVTFVGRVEAGKVSAYYSAADVSLLTTARREGLPMAVLEALASGLPCVVPTGSVQSAALSAVLHEVDAADPQALARGLVASTAGRGPRASLLPAEFHLAECAKSYLAAFRELLPASR